MGILLSDFTCAILEIWHCAKFRKLRETSLQKVIFYIFCAKFAQNSQDGWNWTICCRQIKACWKDHCLDYGWTWQWKRHTMRKNLPKACRLCTFKLWRFDEE